MQVRIPIPKREQPVEPPRLPLYAPAPPMPERETTKPTKERDPDVDFRVDLYV